VDLSTTSGKIGFPPFCCAPLGRKHCPMRRDAAFGAKVPPIKAADDFAISEAGRLSIGLMAMAAAGSALFFLKAVPLEWRSQISFSCVL